MTPEQISSIISAMPEGKRKRACLSIFEACREAENMTEDFWLLVDSEYWQGAAMFVIDMEFRPNAPKQATVEMYADMIWEGGA